MKTFLTFGVRVINVKQEKIEELNAPTNLFVYKSLYESYFQIFEILTATFPFSRNSCELTYISCKKYWDLREVSKVKARVQLIYQKCIMIYGHRTLFMGYRNKPNNT